MDVINMTGLGENMLRGKRNSIQERQDYRALEVQGRSLSFIE